MTSVESQSADRIFISMIDPRFRTQVGLRTGEGIRSTRTAGGLTYGPYIELEPGHYSLQVKGLFRNNGEGKAELEVTADCGEFTLAQQWLRESYTENIAEVSLSISVRSRNIEIKIHTDGIADVIASSVLLTRLDQTAKTDRSKELILDNGETTAELLSIGSDRLIVTFQPYGYIGFDRRGFGEDFIPTIGFDVLCFKPRRNYWYQDISEADVRELIWPRIRHYRHRIAYGSSMGGYAAFYFASALRIHEIVALSPQFSADRALVPFETRWEAEATSIAFAHRWPEHNRTVAYVAFDPCDPGDRAHVQSLRKIFPHGKDYSLPYSGHPSTVALAESRLLKDFVKNIFLNRLPQVEDLRRTIRHKCAFTYASLLLMRAAKRRGTLAVRLFASFAAMHSGNLQWLQDITMWLGEHYHRDGRRLLSFHCAAIYACATSPEIDRDSLGVIDVVGSKLPPALRSKFDLWTSGWCYRYRAGDGGLQTRVGVVARSEFISTGKAGTLSFGPYIDLPAGKFQAIVKGRARQASLTIRATANYARHELARRDSIQRDGEFTEVIDCSCAQECKATEITVEVPANAVVSISSIEIKMSEIALGLAVGGTYLPTCSSTATDVAEIA